MLDIGWSEILVVAIVAILVVGPKELPGMLRTFGRAMTKLRSMANEFRGQFEEALKEADLDDVRKGLSSVQKLNPANTLRDAINPLRQMGQDIKSDLQKATKVDAPVSKPTVTPQSPVAAADAAPATMATASVDTESPSILPPTVSADTAGVAQPSATKTKKAPLKAKTKSTATASTTSDASPAMVPVRSSAKAVAAKPGGNGVAAAKPAKAKPAASKPAAAKPVATKSVAASTKTGPADKSAKQSAGKPAKTGEA